jgi:hypothetical protein
MFSKCLSKGAKPEKITDEFSAVKDKITSSSKKKVSKQKE